MPSRIELASAGSAGGSVQIPMTSGHGYYYTPQGPTAATALTRANGDMSLMPIWIRKGVTVSALGVEVSVGGSAGSVYRLGIYLDSGGGFPGSLLVDAGTVATTSGGTKQVAIAQPITSAGLYWLASSPQGNPGTAAQMTFLANCLSGPFWWWGTSPPTGGGSGSPGYVYGGVTGALPASLTPGSIITNTGGVVRTFLRIQ